MLCVWLEDVRCQIRERAETGETHFAALPHVDYGGRALGGIQIALLEIGQLEVYLGGIVFVRDGPRNRVGYGKIGGVVDESLYF